MVSYKKLWHLLLDKDMKKKDLMSLAHISPATMSKLSRGKNINTDILVKICATLKCNISDIMEIAVTEVKNG